MRRSCTVSRSVSRPTSRKSYAPRAPLRAAPSPICALFARPSLRPAFQLELALPVRSFHASPVSMKKGGKEKDDKKTDKQRGGGDQLELDTDDLKQKMERAVDSVKQDLANIRTGRANPAILDRVQVTLDGASHSILQLGQISVKDANTLLVTAFAEEHAKLIREAIEKSNLGFTPQQDQRFVLIPIPKATQEYRDQLKAQVGKAAELGKLRIRNSRKTALDELKRIEKQMSKDKFKSTEKEVQTLTDKYIANIDTLCKAKEKDIANF